MEILGLIISAVEPSRVIILPNWDEEWRHEILLVRDVLVQRAPRMFVGNKGRYDL